MRPDEGRVDSRYRTAVVNLRRRALAGFVLLALLVAATNDATPYVGR